jgi:hypothetical protein
MGWLRRIALALLGRYGAGLRFPHLLLLSGGGARPRSRGARRDPLPRRAVAGLDDPAVRDLAKRAVALGRRGREAQRQPLRATDEDAAGMDDGAPTGRARSGRPGQHGLDDEPGLEPGEMGPDAEMRAASEAHVVLRKAPIETQLIGRFEDALVAIRGGPGQQQPILGLEVVPRRGDRPASRRGSGS